MSFKIEWHDHGREPQVAPNPDFPMGKDVVAVPKPGAPTCKTALPYPAKRCGYYLVECNDCGIKIAITTAGRPDDPRSLEIGCRKGSPGKIVGHAAHAGIVDDPASE